MIPRSGEFADQERITYRGGVSYSYAIAQGLSVGAGASYSRNYYDDPDREDTHSQDYSISTRVARDSGIRIFSDRTSATASVGYSRGDRIAGNSGFQSGTDRVTGRLGIETRLRRDLRHSFTFSRALREGFNSDFEGYDNYRYTIDWDGPPDVSASAFAGLSRVSPTLEKESDYRNWSAGVVVTYPLLSFATFTFSSTYTLRDNRQRDLAEAAAEAADEEELEAEDVNDYETWANRVSTGFRITRQTTFTTSYSHIERYSDSEVLEYERDVFAALLTYSHQF